MSRATQGSHPDLHQGLRLCSTRCFLLMKGPDYAVTPELVDLFPVEMQTISSWWKNDPKGHGVLALQVVRQLCVSMDHGTHPHRPPPLLMGVSLTLPWVPSLGVKKIFNLGVLYSPLSVTVLRF